MKIYESIDDSYCEYNSYDDYPIEEQFMEKLKNILI